MKYKPRPLPHKKRGRRPAPVKRIPRCIPITDANYERILAAGAGTASDGIEIILQEVSAHADDPTRIVLPGAEGRAP